MKAVPRKRLHNSCGWTQNLLSTAPTLSPLVTTPVAWQNGIWTEVVQSDKKSIKISSLRRALQRQHLKLMTDMVLRNVNGASEHRLVLAQVKVADKPNEITAIPALLELLDLKESIITIDAMGTQTAVAAPIYNSNADYILALKANHPTLHEQVKNWFEQARIYQV